MSSAEEIEEAPSGLSPAAAQAYVDARVQGLCHAGAPSLVTFLWRRREALLGVGVR